MEKRRAINPLEKRGIMISYALYSQILDLPIDQVNDGIAVVKEDDGDDAKNKQNPARPKKVHPPA
jgi:hypothetical protein